MAGNEENSVLFEHQQKAQNQRTQQAVSVK